MRVCLFLIQCQLKRGSSLVAKIREKVAVGSNSSVSGTNKSVVHKIQFEDTRVILVAKVVE